MNIVNQFPMQWEAKYREMFPDAVWSREAIPGHDLYLFMWCNEETVQFMNTNPDAKVVIFVRRYEVFSKHIRQIDWTRVDAVIMVNDHLASMFEYITGVKPYVIYNAVDLAKWKYKERSHGRKVAWVGFINQKKNLPLALQIMAKMPGYDLHIAGGLQDEQTWEYLASMAGALKLRVYCEGEIPHEFMDKWLEDKNYILSTAISEGCPNNVIEAMAKGIKPIVHNWPGAKEQFGEYVFNTVDEAVGMMFGKDNGSFRTIPKKYESAAYRSFCEQKFGEDNYSKVKDIINGVLLPELQEVVA